MAIKSLSAATMKLVLIFLVSIAVLPRSSTARTVAVEPSSSISQNLSFLSCAPFILDATLCMVDVIKFPIAPHPFCCKAIFKLNDCAPEIFEKIPPVDMDVIKKICAFSKASWFHIAKFGDAMQGNIQRVIREGGTTLIWLHPSTSNGLLLCNLYLRFYALAGNDLITIKDAWNEASHESGGPASVGLLDRE
ncbi:unnamed protein product [Citrullus colocynthis]|uniref:Prolamin-like domain-containing protein n=1 Tax=Citrullus colocynthis TaxID=252529 RepID=A0ABP0ZFK6_9ROSI